MTKNFAFSPTTLRMQIFSTVHLTSAKLLYPSMPHLITISY